MKKPFDFEDIEDCRVIIVAHGKHWALVPKETMDKNNCRIDRVSIIDYLLETHDILDTPLDEIKISHQELKKIKKNPD